MDSYLRLLGLSRRGPGERTHGWLYGLYARRAMPMGCLRFY